MEGYYTICFSISIFVHYFMRIILILLLAGIAFSAEAQSRKKKKNRDVAEVQEGQPSSLDPSYPQKKYGPKRSTKKKGSGPTYESERQYYERMADLNKAKRKNERMSETPQYSDPTYFGHKHPPKRRPPSKMKYCKVCGIRH